MKAPHPFGHEAAVAGAALLSRCSTQDKRRAGGRARGADSRRSPRPESARAGRRHYEPGTSWSSPPDSMPATGGLTEIDIRGVSGRTLKDILEYRREKPTWASAFRTSPNLLMLIRARRARPRFCNGPTCCGASGRLARRLPGPTFATKATDGSKPPPRRARHGRSTWPAWAEGPRCFRLADSWYMGANIPGKPSPAPALSRTARTTWRSVGRAPRTATRASSCR